MGKILQGYKSERRIGAGSPGWWTLDRFCIAIQGYYTTTTKKTKSRMALLPRDRAKIFENSEQYQRYCHLYFNNFYHCDIVRTVPSYFLRSQRSHFFSNCSRLRDFLSSRVISRSQNIALGNHQWFAWFENRNRRLCWFTRCPSSSEDKKNLLQSSFNLMIPVWLSCKWCFFKIMSWIGIVFVWNLIDYVFRRFC